jgi:hypothetical protein
MNEADEWRRKAKAIEAYLRSPELQRPMMGAQRHVEARIGELLGPAEWGGDRKSDQIEHDRFDLVDADDRVSFRLLAEAIAPWGAGAGRVAQKSAGLPSTQACRPACDMREVRPHLPAKAKRRPFLLGRLSPSRLPRPDCAT